MSCVYDWSSAKSRIEHFSHTLTIDNFSVVYNMEDGWISSVFPVDVKSDLQWTIELIPKNMNLEGREYFSLNIKQLYYRADVDKAKVKCYIQSQEDTVQKKVFRLHSAQGLNFERFVYLCTLMEQSDIYLPNDKLIIRCEIDLLTDAACTCGRTKPIMMPESKLSDDFGKLFNNPEYSDMTIVTLDGKEIYAHKLVLSARNEFFKGMFSYKKSENTDSSRVEINDINSDVLIEFIRFLYTDKVPKLKTMAKDLLIAGDKYLTDNLKAICENYLHSELSVDNAVDIFLLAETHNAVQLKARSIEYINNNFQDVINTDAWKEFSITNYDLVKEYFNELFEPSGLRSMFQRYKSNYRQYSCEKCG